MTTDLRSFIYNYVWDHNGCKATELAVGFAEAFPNEVRSLFVIMKGMVTDGELIEFEYELASVPGRLKSFLLPGLKGGQLGTRSVYTSGVKGSRRFFP